MNNRDTFFDNLKGFLIFFVVLGHFANLNKAIPLWGGINNVIYSFHMPLFIFVSGYFSKSVLVQRSKEITSLLYPYLIFELLDLLFTKATGLGEGRYNIFIPANPNWYLLAMFTWRLLIPYFTFFNKRLAFLFLIVFAVGIGFVKEFYSFLSLYRTFYFMPYFVLGYYCKDLKGYIERGVKFKAVWIGLFFVAISAVFYLSFRYEKFNFWLSYAYTPYNGYRDDMMLTKMCFRIFAWISGFALSWCFLFLIPSKQTILTKIGSATLFIFLSHMFIVWPLNKLLSAHTTPVVGISLSVLASAAIIWILSRDVVTRILTPLTDFTFFKKKAQPVP